MLQSALVRRASLFLRSHNRGVGCDAASVLLSVPVFLFVSVVIVVVFVVL